jgi:hypothetical protein
MLSNTSSKRNWRGWQPEMPTLCYILHSVSHWPVLVYFINQKLQHCFVRHCLVPQLAPVTIQRDTCPAAPADVLFVCVCTVRGGPGLCKA